MSSANSPLILPTITIDPTFPRAIRDVDGGTLPSEKFWISCYKTEQPSIHATVHVELDEVDRSLVHLKAQKDDVRIAEAAGVSSLSVIQVALSKHTTGSCDRHGRLG